jgi:hypothetical protein
MRADSETLAFSRYRGFRSRREARAENHCFEGIADVDELCCPRVPSNDDSVFGLAGPTPLPFVQARPSSSAFDGAYL